MNAPAKGSPEVSVVMPCYNEEACIRQTASQLLDAFAAEGIAVQLVLVENGSRDRTGAVMDELIAEGRAITKVVVAVNRGYGYGVLQGLRACTAQYVGYLCADGEVPPESAVITYRNARAATGPVLAKVRRKYRKDSWRRKLVSILYTVNMIGVFGWLRSVDLNSSPKIMRREIYEKMKLESNDWFLDPELMVKAAYLGLPVVENPVECHLRAGGKSNVRWTTCLEFMKNILRFRLGAHLKGWKKEIRAGAAAKAAATNVAARKG